MARDPMKGLLLGMDEESEPDTAGDDSEPAEGADEGDLSAAQAAMDAIAEGDAQAFLDAIRLLK